MISPDELAAMKRQQRLANLNPVVDVYLFG